MNNSAPPLPDQEVSLTGLWPKLLSNFSWLFVGTVGKVIIRFVAALYLARVLGPAGFGQIAYALALLAYFVLFVDSGMQTYGTRVVAATPEDKERIFGQILPTRFALALFSVIILFICAPYFTPSTVIQNLVIVFSFALIPEAINLAWFFLGFEKMMIVGISEFLKFAVYLVLILLIVKSPDQISSVPLFFVGGYLASALLTLVIYTSRWRWPRFCISIKANWKVFQSAVPMVTILFYLQVYYSLDTLMLGFYRSETDIGFYNAAYRIIMGIIMFNNILMYSAYPTFSKFYRVQRSQVSKLLQRILSLSMAIAIPIGIAGTILSRPIMVTLFGPEYATGNLALQLLVWSAMLALLAGNFSFCLVACHQQKALASSVGIGTASNIALNLLLIPPYGIMGACVATIIAQGSMLIFQMAVFARRIFPTFPSFMNTLKALGAGIIMGFVLIYLQSTINFFILIVIGSVLYLFILWLLGGLPLPKSLSFKK